MLWVDWLWWAWVLVSKHCNNLWMLWVDWLWWAWVLVSKHCNNLWMLWVDWLWWAWVLVSKHCNNLWMLWVDWLWWAWVLVSKHCNNLWMLWVDWPWWNLYTVVLIILLEGQVCFVLCRTVWRLQTWTMMWWEKCCASYTLAAPQTWKRWRTSCWLLLIKWGLCCCCGVRWFSVVSKLIRETVWDKRLIQEAQYTFDKLGTVGS